MYDIDIMHRQLDAEASQRILPAEREIPANWPQTSDPAAAYGDEARTHTLESAVRAAEGLEDQISRAGDLLGP